MIAPFLNFPERCRKCKFLLINHIDMNGTFYRCYANTEIKPDGEMCHSFQYAKETLKAAIKQEG